MTGHGEESPQEEQSQVRQQNLHGSGVWFFVEHAGDKVDEACLKLAGEARTIAARLRGPATAVIVGSAPEGLVESLVACAPDSALLVKDPHLDAYAGEAYADVLAQLVAGNPPRVILLAASTIGNDLAPRLAARLDCTLASRYTEIEVDPNGEMTVRRPVHGGNAQATLLPRRFPLVATVDAQILSEPTTKAATEPEVVPAKVRVDPKSSVTKVVDYLRADPCAVCVSESEFVIGIGKGLGSAENLQAVDDLARVLGASIGGSRRATDERWIPDERRIGLTGKTIAPRVYLICGISGAFHHTLSIKEARLKIVINTDPNAPISQMADLVVVGDMQQIIPELTKQLRDVLRPAG
jgi:electron transfer flavoprotein alpha subunit